MPLVHNLSVSAYGQIIQLKREKFLLIKQKREKYEKSWNDVLSVGLHQIAGSERVGDGGAI